MGVGFLLFFWFIGRYKRFLRFFSLLFFCLGVEGLMKGYWFLCIDNKDV